MNPPTTLRSALSRIEELEGEVADANAELARAKDKISSLDEEMDNLMLSHAGPDELQAFGDKWAKLRNGFIGHAACNLTFATMDHQGKRYTAHGDGLLEAISRCEENFAKGISCRTSIQLPKFA